MSRSHVRNYFPEIYSNTIVAVSANWLMSEKALSDDLEADQSRPSEDSHVKISNKV